MSNLIFVKKRLAQFLRENASKRKIIIISSYDKIEVVAGAVRHCLKYFGSNTSILCFKSRVPRAFAGFKDRVRVSEDYLNREDYLKIDDYVFKDIAKNWYRDFKRFKEIFVYRNVELGQIAEYDLQPFLIARIKALAVIAKALKKEDCEAIFIIDSNGELDSFDILINRQYRILADFVKIKNKKSAIEKIRAEVSSVIAKVIDKFAASLLSPRANGREPNNLIDARLYFQLGVQSPNNFILAPFEKGLNLRLKCILKKRGYIVFDPDTNCLRPSFETSSSAGNFDFRSLEDKFVFEGVPYWEIVQNKITAIIQKDFIRYRINIDILAKAHTAYNIKSITLRNDLRELQKTVTLASKEFDISTLVVYHGIVHEPNGHSVIVADKMAVWGNRDADWYKELGNDSNKIEVVGIPGWSGNEAYCSKGGDRRYSRKLGLGKSKYLATFIGPGIGNLKFSSFTTDDVTSVLIEEVTKAIKSIGNINLIVKLHPNEKAKPYAKLRSKNVAIVEKMNLHKLIKSSDMVIINDSTVGLDAVIMKKPLIAVDLVKRPGFIPYAERQVALGVYKKEEMENAIREIISNENVKAKMELAREGFINDFAYRLDGKTTERVLKLIKRIS